MTLSKLNITSFGGFDFKHNDDEYKSNMDIQNKKREFLKELVRKEEMMTISMLFKLDIQNIKKPQELCLSIIRKIIMIFSMKLRATMKLQKLQIKSKKYSKIHDFQPILSISSLD